MYMTQLAAERHVVVYRECLFFMHVFLRRLQSQEINPVQEQEIISVYCLCISFNQDLCWSVVSAENITIANVSPGKESLNLFAVKIARRKNSVPACGCRSTSYLSSHLIFRLYLICWSCLLIDFNTVPGLLFPTSSWTGAIQFHLRRSGPRGLGTYHASCSNVRGMSLQ